MVELRTDFFIISLLATIWTVFGCGVVPAGQGSTRRFTVSGFALPVSMVYTGSSTASTRVPNIAVSKEVAQGFIQRLVMQTVFGVLESQGRSALLPDGVILSILSQLTVNITYEPLLCQDVILDPDKDTVDMMKQKCIVVGNTVTGICTGTRNGGKCTPTPMSAMPTPVPDNHTSISGTLMTTNVIMANWSRTMWQSVLNRAVRMLALAPFGSQFFSASVTVAGN
ncbi:hypothetical protein KIN20_030574 [Parelaphostrongylus tenuis]|uniref:Uncharacterized protein n=1 Tax=Parelaphostrongylus tenuis TaxID=148309 RepID=A0AAD5WGH6_PARTN|nr:hypothetical protein KIN20_030574 [Parelaphostrongylus tenuis]